MKWTSIVQKQKWQLMCRDAGFLSFLPALRTFAVWNIWIERIVLGIAPHVNRNKVADVRRNFALHNDCIATDYVLFVGIHLIVLDYSFKIIKVTKLLFNQGRMGTMDGEARCNSVLFTLSEVFTHWYLFPLFVQPPRHLNEVGHEARD